MYAKITDNPEIPVLTSRDSSRSAEGGGLMSRTSGVLAAMKASPGRGAMAPQSGGWGSINSVAANAMYGNPRNSGYGPFLPRPSERLQ